MSPQSIPTEPDVSVAIVNFNGVKALEPTIRSVLAQKGVRIAQVMLADNASTDGSVEFVRREFPSVRIEVLPENRGPNPARNKGLQLSTTDLVLVMDNEYLRRSLEVRVQALFGLDRHPMVGDTPLLLELTSPAGRPIQTTRDLPGFWRGSWRDVAKDMKGRYPKHRWPDTPWSEDPGLRTKNAHAAAKRS